MAHLRIIRPIFAEVVQILGHLRTVILVANGFNFLDSMQCLFETYLLTLCVIIQNDDYYESISEMDWRAGSGGDYGLFLLKTGKRI